MSSALLSLEIGGTKLQAYAGDASGQLHTGRRWDVDPTGGAEGIRAQIRAGLDELIRRFSPVALGVGFGGPVDWRTGRISCSHQIAGWSGFELRQWLKELTGLRVVVENDANLAALGEAERGAGAGLSPVFYVTLGSGVGGGLVVDGRIYHGTLPGEAEIGHVLLDREGTIVEERCSGWAVNRRVRELVSAHPSSRLAQLARASPGHEARHLRPACEAGDPWARHVLDQTASDLGWALSHVVHLFHPQVIVLGGGLSLVGEPLRAGVEGVLRRHVMEVFQGTTQVRLAALGEEAVPVGALLAAARATDDSC